MSYQVLLTDDAIADMEELDDCISENDAPENADYVLSKIDEIIQSLTDMPERGSYPCELATLGIKEYRERVFKPYRIIYRIMDKKVYIYLVTDARRDMKTLLQRRLLSA
ncbi:MAG: type II toxin-antitoxin system RelE/ParE family toxin [Pseudomonadales bacterium]